MKRIEKELGMLPPLLLFVCTPCLIYTTSLGQRVFLEYESKSHLGIIHDTDHRSPPRGTLAVAECLTSHFGRLTWLVAKDRHNIAIDDDITVYSTMKPYKRGTFFRLAFQLRHSHNLQYTKALSSTNETVFAGRCIHHRANAHPLP